MEKSVQDISLNNKESHKHPKKDKPSSRLEETYEAYQSLAQYKGNKIDDDIYEDFENPNGPSNPKWNNVFKHLLNEGQQDPKLKFLYSSIADKKKKSIVKIPRRRRTKMSKLSQMGINTSQDFYNMSQGDNELCSVASLSPHRIHPKHRFSSIESQKGVGSALGKSLFKKENTRSNKSLGSGIRLHIPKQSDDKLSMLKNEVVELQKSLNKKSGFLSHILRGGKVIYLNFFRKPVRGFCCNFTGAMSLVPLKKSSVNNTNDPAGKSSDNGGNKTGKHGISRLSAIIRRDLIPAQRFNKSVLQRNQVKNRCSEAKVSKKNSLKDISRDSPNFEVKNSRGKVNLNESPTGKEFKNLITFNEQNGKMSNESSVSVLDDTDSSVEELRIPKNSTRNCASSLEHKSVLFNNSYLSSSVNHNLIGASVLSKSSERIKKMKVGIKHLSPLPSLKKSTLQDPINKEDFYLKREKFLIKLLKKYKKLISKALFSLTS
ncbi:unnamed protein product [Moneuplotes crassus]|uniref:Uncharacterized protein n=1 Tax=Euplotes crassus TaxID=5936 RepID=A0AAD1Y5E8_EUPCR|nr:unnamed protein product [Moneuplotes crassus]